MRSMEDMVSEGEWWPMDESRLWDLINAAGLRMSLEQARLWQVIKIEPARWTLHPWGDPGGGFWAVAVIGQYVLWFNDIEDGFNISRYRDMGVIGEYWCNQDELEHAVQSVLNMISHGWLPAQASPPFV